MKRKNKWNAVRKTSPIIGRTFHSKGECEYGEHLFAREANGEIEDLQFQVAVRMLDNHICWKVDFSYIEYQLTEAIPRPQRIWDEFKGPETADFKLKKKIWIVGYGPGILRVTYKRRSKIYPYRTDEYIPDGFDPNNNPNIIKPEDTTNE
jgi:hypothetical protein